MADAGKPEKCPRCGSADLTEHDDCGPDTYDDDITWIALSCDNCGLWWSGWSGKWLVGVTSWRDEEDAVEFVA